MDIFSKTFVTVCVAMALFCFAMVGLSLPSVLPPPEASTVLVSTMDNGAHGTGVYIGSGRVITAGHVAKDADKDGHLLVHFGSVSIEAAVRWMDEKADVGLLTLDVSNTLLKPASLACGSRDPAIGDTIRAFGFPLHLGAINTWGRVASAVKPLGDEKITAFIADLTIAPGNSGGPVFAQDGTVVGITIAMAAFPIGGMYEAVVPLSYIIPRSVICHELAIKHEAPVFGQPST